MNSQRGFLLIVAIVLLVIIGILSSAIIALGVRSGIMPIYFDAKNKAVFLAESGLEQGRKNLTEATIASRQTCVGLSNTTAMTGGSFTVIPASDSANLINPRYAFSTLATTITSGSSPTTISVTDSSVFAPYGRVLIGREVFQYDRISNSTTLVSIKRAQDGSIAADHPSGTLVSQYQCTIESTGSSPAAAPSGVREYRQGIRQQAVFAVGGSGNILRWNGGTENQWEGLSLSGVYDFNSVSAANYHNAWAVADRESNKLARFSRLLGNSWSNFTVEFDANDAVNLHGVYATSESEAWAIGDEAKSNTIGIYRWTRNVSNANNNWCLLDCGGKTVNDSGIGNTAKDFYAIKAIDTNGDGYADVGYAGGGNAGSGGTANRGVVLFYNGTTWSNMAIPESSIGQIYGVDFVENGAGSPKDVYFVAKASNNSSDGKIMRLKDGVTWTVITTTQRMRGVSAIDTDGDGYANYVVFVGDGGMTYTFDGSTFSGPFTLVGNNLLGVVVLSPTDTWIVGAQGVRIHYNGTSADVIEVGGLTSQPLNGVSAAFPKQNPVSAWYDVIN